MGSNQRYVPLICIIVLLSVAAGVQAEGVGGPLAWIGDRFTSLINRNSRPDTSNPQRTSQAGRHSSRPHQEGPTSHTPENSEDSWKPPVRGSRRAAAQHGSSVHRSVTPRASKIQNVDAPAAILAGNRRSATSQGQSCGGRVSAVWCREDSKGALQDIAYLNTVTGLQRAGCSNQQGMSESYSKVLFLDEDESIVSMRACSRDRDGYASLTFITDGDQELTCGRGERRDDYEHHHHDHDHNYEHDHSDHEDADDDDQDDDDNDKDDAQWKANLARAREFNGSFIRTPDGERGRVQILENIDDKEDGNMADDDQEVDAGRSSRRRERVHRGRSHRARRHRIPRRYSHDFEDAEEEKRGGNSHRRSLLAGFIEDLRGLRNVTGASAAKPSPPAAARATAQKPATFWMWGDNNDDECEEYSPDHLPPWASVQGWGPRANKAAGNHTGSRRTPGEILSKSGRGSQAYVSFNNTRYYKDFATYTQQLAIHHASPSAMGPKPAWFFDVVQPLAAVNLQCDGQGYATQVSNLCWNEQYSPKPILPGVPDLTTLALEATDDSGRPLGCPSSPGSVQQLEQSLQTLSQQLSAASGGVVRQVVWQQYNPSRCQGVSPYHNTTITLHASYIPGPNHFLLDVAKWLLHNTQQNICDVQHNSRSVCSGTIFFSISHLMGDITGQQAQQQQLGQVKILQERQQRLHMLQQRGEQLLLR